MTGLAQDDITRMRDQLFFDGPERNRRLSRFWLLLPLAAVIASAGVVSDSTATVIGAMIVAPLMTPILGIVLAVALTDGPNLRRCLLLVITGAAAVVAVGWLLGLLAPYPVVAQTNAQVAARVTLQLVDLVAALATGAVGSVALARSDISDTLPGVAIAISLVPPLAVVGLTLESGAPRQSLAALLLFTTNVAAILATGIVVMALYRVRRASGRATAAAYRYRGAVTVIAALLLAIIVPLTISSNRIDKTTIRQDDVQAGFSLASGPVAAQAPGLGQQPRCAVELTEIRTPSQDWWTLGFEATGPDNVLRRALQATAALVFAQAMPGGVEPGPHESRSLWSGCASGQAPSVTPTPEGCPSAEPAAPSFCSLRPERQREEPGVHRRSASMRIRSSDTFEGFQPPGPDGCDEFLVVLLVLVGVAL